jgi:signal peptidase
MSAVGLLASAVTLLGAAWMTVGPRMAGWKGMIVLSGSMAPAMPTGGISLVEPATIDSLSVGDIVTFRRPGGSGAIVSHRVVAIGQQLGDTTLWTKGDANAAPDLWVVGRSDVVGRVRLTVPYAGYASQRLHTRSGFLVLLLLPASIVVVGELRLIARELRSKRMRQVAL